MLLHTYFDDAPFGKTNMLSYLTAFFPVIIN